MIKMKIPRHFFIVLPAITFCLSMQVFGAESITVDVGKVIKENVNKGIAGANLCWLTDSDKYWKRPVSMEQAVRELGCKSLRFPYGHLADNYLWHTPPYNDADKGLRHAVASKTQIPMKWTWAVKPDGTFKAAMDFDEYMVFCKKLDITPLVVVNALSCKYKEGPTKEFLIESAAQWVRYARKKGYKVGFWQVGNEIDHHPDIITMEEFAGLYEKIAGAMKEEDPSIKVGPGILSKPEFYTAILKRCPDLMDFASVHQYMFKWQESCSTYEKWKESTSDFNKNMKRVDGALSKSKKPDIPVLVTETGVTGAPGKRNNIYKALWWYEVLMMEISSRNVAYVYYWGLHSPWTKNVFPDEKTMSKNDVGIALNQDSNARRPTGEIIKLVNDNILDNMVAANRVAGYLRTYAFASADGKQVTLFIANKNDKGDSANISFDSFEPSAAVGRIDFVGKDPYDTAPVVKKGGKVKVKGRSAQVKLAPLSLTILRFTAD